MPFPPVKNTIEVPLEVFGGRVTEMAPTDCPEGVSPDEQDNTFIPGEVKTRPCLERTLANAPANTTCTYQKSFVTDTGAIKNLYLFSNGQLFWEDPIAAPGTGNLLYTGPPGSYAKSATMFGREFIALNDTLHGSTVPLQWDGVNLDRVTQDGPGAAPTIASIAYPANAIISGGGGTISIASIASSGRYTTLHGFRYATFTVTLTAPATLLEGTSTTISGNTFSSFNNTWTILSILSPTQFTVTFYQTTNNSGTGGTATTPTYTLVRRGNTVTANFGGPGNFQVGYQALVAGVPANQIGGGITSVVIDNEDLPGIATITTATPHGLAPEEEVFLDAIAPNTVAIASFSYDGLVADVVTASAHGLSVGSIVNVALGGSGVLEPQTVSAVISPTEFICGTSTTGAATGTGGSVQYIFPLASAYGSPTQQSTLNTDTFQVVACPTPTTFQVEITYTDGTWTSGTVSFAWNGTFYVTGVNANGIQYQQYGPDALTTDTNGTITPYGQAAPGFHLMRCNFLTRQGAVLKSGPFVQFVADGGQYLSITNIPIGPANIVARILEFTGADGAFYFYLPVPAQVNGQIVSTATQIDDNTTTSVLLDFSDNSLFGGLATSIPGNDLITQITLDGALGFGQYATRLMTYGQRNRIQNFLNLSFDGGHLPSNDTIPAGWNNVDITTGGLAANAVLPPSSAWFITALGAGGDCGQLSQSAYQSPYGNPILTGNTPYTLRVWLQPSAIDDGLNFYAVISSSSTGFTSTAVINGAAMSLAGSFVQVNFSATMPLAIPFDMVLTIYAVSTTTTRTLLVDEISIIYSQTPFLDGILFGSYGNNPEGIAGVTGKFGPVTDTRKVMDFGVMRETFYMLTQEPSGRLHETTDNGTTEPEDWTVTEVGANCGALSAFSLTKSQADDTAASGGEEWMAWASLSGARIFGGAYPDKISQEIQPDWEQINPAAALTVWCVNDPVERALYFGVPLGTATAPSKLLFMSYRQLDSANAIASSPPFRVSFTGRLIATDNSRKWSLWNMAMNTAALMYRAAGDLSLVLGGGNGVMPGSTGFGNVYTLNPAKYTDDDYGQVNSYYFTYAFVNRGAEAQLGVGSHQKGLLGLLATVTWPAGTMLVQVAPNNLANIWPLSCSRTVSQPHIDLQWGYGNQLIARGSRFFFKFSSVPLPGQTDNAYNLQMVTIALAPTRLRTRGASQ